MSQHVLKKQAIRAPEFLNDPIEYNKSFSRGIKVAFGGLTFLFISGTASVDKKGRTCYKGDFLRQAQRTFENLTALLHVEGAEWHHVVQIRCYLKKMRDYAQFNEARNDFYKKEGLSLFPASVCIEANLCRPELLIEIEAIVLIDNTLGSTVYKIKKQE